MAKKILLGILIGVLITSLCAWCPWLTPRAMDWVVSAKFTAAWAFVIEGCGTHCAGCGVQNIQKVPFGASATLYYQCGLVPPDAPLQSAGIFVSFLGTSHGLPRP